MPFVDFVIRVDAMKASFASIVVLPGLINKKKSIILLKLILCKYAYCCPLSDKLMNIHSIRIKCFAMFGRPVSKGRSIIWKKYVMKYRNKLH